MPSAGWTREGMRRQKDSPPLVVIPRDDLVECVVKRDARRCVHDTRPGIVHEVLGHDLVVRVPEDAHVLLGLGRGLEGGEQLRVGAPLLEFDGEVDEGDVWGGAADGHAGEDALELGEDNADGLGCAGRGWDEVGDGGTDWNVEERVNELTSQVFCRCIRPRVRRCKKEGLLQSAESNGNGAQDCRVDE